MSKSDFVDGICFNSDHNGLLSVDERLIKIIKKEPIADTYYVEHTPFARGKFAAVRKCTHKESGVEYAAKFIRKRRRAMDQRQDILHEVAVLKLAANNTRIVRLHEVYETPSEMALVLEMASGGELQHVLDAEDGLPEFHAVKFMRQIIEGLSFLHEQNIAHLDLKPQNLLLTGVYPDCDIKLCDFGISRIIQNGVEVREILGTPDYVAPEILSYEPISLATDIWSVGVLAYVLLSGYSPFGGDTKQETFCNISQCCLNFPEDLFEGVSSTAKEFIRATLVKDPSNRLTSRQCLEHPWLSGSSCALTSPSKELALSLTEANQPLEQEETDGVKTSVVITDLPSHILEASRANGIKSSHSLENGISCSRKKDDSNETKTAEGNHHAHSDDSEELPVNKRPKNSPTHYPVASCLSCAQCGSQCCHIHKTPRSRHQHHHSSLTNSPVEITVDRAIIC